MRNEFRNLLISGLREKKENHVIVPDLSVIITSGSLHPDYEARLWHILLQKLCLIAEHRKCTYLGGRGWGGTRMKKKLLLLNKHVGFKKSRLYPSHHMKEAYQRMIFA